MSKSIYRGKIEYAPILVLGAFACSKFTEIMGQHAPIEVPNKNGNWAGQPRLAQYMSESFYSHATALCTRGVLLSNICLQRVLEELELEVLASS